jgi:hypothetical protein
VNRSNGIIGAALIHEIAAHKIVVNLNYDNEGRHANESNGTNTNGNPKVRRLLDSFIGLIPNMAVTLLLLIIFLVLARLGSKLFNRLFASNNKALEQLFSTVIYAILSIDFIMLGARAK